MIRELLDSDGENRAVRAFLMLYGYPGLTALSMKKHMIASGFPHYPDWVQDIHLTKAGAQIWLRLLFALEEVPDMKLKVGGEFNWKGQPERLIYLGKKGNWHEFKKIGDPRAVWCEILDEDLHMIEETKP